MAHDIDTRPISLVDLPLIRRLTDQATVLDSEIAFTRQISGSEGAILSNILLPQRGLCTLIARNSQEQVVGQFRLLPDDHNAHVTYIAPSLADDADDRVWLHILDAMAKEAGKYGAHALIADVNEDSYLFETMRTAGFAVYARQQVWKREPESNPLEVEPIELTKETGVDVPGIQSLITHIVPTLTQPVIAPPSDLDGWVYRKADRTEAYVAVSEGKRGLYLIPFIHPDISSEAPLILENVLEQAPKSRKLPVYICMRRYQDWMGTALSNMQFKPGPAQAVMVKHIRASVRQAVFKPVQEGLPIVGGPIKPPTNMSCRSSQRSIWKNKSQMI